MNGKMNLIVYMCCLYLLRAGLAYCGLNKNDSEIKNEWINEDFCIE